MKRFTATEKWDKEWHRKLPPRLKCFWDYICSKCDNAGIWEPDFELASFMIGERVTKEDLIAFGDRIESLSCGKYWVTGFVEFQVGKLSKDCRPHAQIIALLEKYNLMDRVCIPYGYPIHRVKDKDIDKDKDKDKDTERGVGETSIAHEFTLEDVKAAASNVGLPESELENLYHHFNGQGWVKSNGQRIVKLHSVISEWKKRWEENGRKPLFTNATNQPNGQQRVDRNKGTFNENVDPSEYEKAVKLAQARNFRRSET